MRITRLALALALIAEVARAQEPVLPIIDMHLHALGADHQGSPPVGMCTPINPFPAWDQAGTYGADFMAMLKHPPCPNPVWSPLTDEALMRETLAVMERRNIYGVLSGPFDRVAEWRRIAPRRLIPALMFQIGPRQPPPDSLRALHAGGHLDVLGEITNQYAGILPDDVRMEPYWSLAEELDLPVGIHLGPGPPGVAYLGAGQYRARLHSALTLEEVLVRHPRLRLYAMHAGYPLLDDLLALLYSHPQVYLDVGVIVYTQPRAAFYRYLQGIVDAGFGKRIMFGSDQMVWPGVIERAIAVIEEAPFLTTAQKRDILYHNAARFLRLSAEEIARHHGR